MSEDYNDPEYNLDLGEIRHHLRHHDEIAALRAELEQHKSILANPEAVRLNIMRGQIKIPADLVFLHDDFGPVAAIRAENQRLRAENARMRGALEWYADKKNYSGQIPGHLEIVGREWAWSEYFDKVRWFMDEGRRARAALAGEEAQA